MSALTMSSWTRRAQLIPEHARALGMVVPQTGTQALQRVTDPPSETCKHTVRYWEEKLAQYADDQRHGRAPLPPSRS